MEPARKRALPGWHAGEPRAWPSIRALSEQFATLATLVARPRPPAFYRGCSDPEARRLYAAGALDHQVSGVMWLGAMNEAGANCILADEQGLGKTAQSVLFLRRVWDGFLTAVEDSSRGREEAFDVGARGSVEASRAGRALSSIRATHSAHPSSPTSPTGSASPSGSADSPNSPTPSPRQQAQQGPTTRLSADDLPLRFSPAGRRQAYCPFLVAAPNSVVQNWSREALLWGAGDIRPIVFCGGPAEKSAVKRTLKGEIFPKRSSGRGKSSWVDELGERLAGARPGAGDEDAVIEISSEESQQDGSGDASSVDTTERGAKCTLGKAPNGEINPGTPHNLIILPYSCLKERFFQLLTYSVIIFDEGHLLSNAKTARNASARLLARNSDHIVLLTGTPLQCHVSKLSGYLALLQPHANYKRLLDLMEEDEVEVRLLAKEGAGKAGDKAGDEGKDALRGTVAGPEIDYANRVFEIISPFCLRRTKAQILQSIPPLTLAIEKVGLTEAQRAAQEELWPTGNWNGLLKKGGAQRAGESAGGEDVDRDKKSDSGAVSEAVASSRGAGEDGNTADEKGGRKHEGDGTEWEEEGGSRQTSNPAAPRTRTPRTPKPQESIRQSDQETDAAGPSESASDTQHINIMQLRKVANHIMLFRDAFDNDLVDAISIAIFAGLAELPAIPLLSHSPSRRKGVGIKRFQAIAARRLKQGKASLRELYEYVEGCEGGKDAVSALVRVEHAVSELNDFVLFRATAEALEAFSEALDEGILGRLKTAIEECRSRLLSPKIARALEILGSGRPQGREGVANQAGSHHTSLCSVDERESQAPSAKSFACKEKAVVFSFFTSHLDIMQYVLEERGVPCYRLDGSTETQERLSVIDEFQRGKSPSVFLVSTLAGGVGINLTSAALAIFLDCGFNPAAEDQAVNRLHRIGQKRPVRIVRLVSAGSIEEGIMELMTWRDGRNRCVVDRGAGNPKEQGGGGEVGASQVPRDSRDLRVQRVQLAPQAQQAQQAQRPLSTPCASTEIDADTGSLRFREPTWIHGSSPGALSGHHPGQEGLEGRESPEARQSSRKPSSGPSLPPDRTPRRAIAPLPSPSLSSIEISSD